MTVRISQCQVSPKLLRPIVTEDGSECSHNAPIHRPMTKRSSLIDAPIVQALLAYAGPVLGGTIVQSLNATINQFWVSRLLGDTSIAALANSNTIIAVALGAIIPLTMVTSILVGQAIGREDIAGAKRVVGTSTTVLVLLATFTAVTIALLAPQIPRYIGAPEAATVPMTRYLQVLTFSLPLSFSLLLLQTIQRSAGDSLSPFGFLSLSVLLDILLNPLLIRGFGPFPPAGVAGSAIATLIAQATALGSMTVYLRFCCRSAIR